MGRSSHDKNGWRKLLAEIEAAGGRVVFKDNPQHVTVLIPGCRKPVHIGGTAGADKRAQQNCRALLRRSGLLI